MKPTFTFRLPLLLAAFIFTITNTAFAQQSLLVNFGSNSCVPGSSNNPGFSIIKNPLTASPEVLNDCNLTTQLGNFFAVFVAYNPKNNKIYIADVKTFAGTKIWVLDIGLPVSIGCPVTIPAEPTYSYSYVSNNFEFDNNGDLWSLSNYDINTGTCNLDKFDVNTGVVINTRVLQFPTGNFPTNVTSGDITILPNGRMFVMLGNTPSQLYEVTNYVGASGATATYLASLPKDCFGMAFLNGKLEMAGQDFGSSCYYFDYDISSGVLGAEKVFQNGLSPIDDASFTPAIGCGKSLMNSAGVNSNTADLTYHIYVENLGNVILNNINIKEDLASTFGAGNVSNVSASFVPGYNAPNLTINPAYNGTTVTSMLNPGQNLPNNTSTNSDYRFKVQIKCRVTNLISGFKYRNYGIATGNIGSGNGPGQQVDVSDTSVNCGAYRDIVDPNNNGSPGDPGENNGTPYTFNGPLPVRFIGINATLKTKTVADLKWTIATPTINAASFEVQYSLDGITWQSAGELQITNANQSSYVFSHNNIPAAPKLFYRVKQTDKDGEFIYSRVVLLSNKADGNNFTVFPNPASGYISVSIAYDRNTATRIEMFDAVGRKLYSSNVTSSTSEINSAKFPDGTYLLRLHKGSEQSVQKVIIKH